MDTHASNYTATTLIHCTITDNQGAITGGVASVSGAITMKNCVVAGNRTTNSVPANGEPDVRGAFVSNGANFIGDTIHSSGWVATDKTFASTGTTLAQLFGPLAENGGPTPTHMPVPSGPLLDAGANADIPPDTSDADGDGNTTEPAPYDQRGFVRVHGTSVDIGAVEYSAAPFEGYSLIVTTAQDVLNFYDGQTSLRDAITYANTLTGPQTITFSNTTTSGAVNFHDGNPRVISLGSQLPNFTADAILIGPGADKLTLQRPASATTLYRIMAVYRGKAVISGLRMTGGSIHPGGCVYVEGILTMSDCILTENEAPGGYPFGVAGAIHVTNDLYNAVVTNVVLNRCVLSNNKAYTGGALFLGSQGPAVSVTLNDCEVSNNSALDPDGFGGGRGGGICSSGNLVLNRCTFKGNTASQGGGIYNWDGPLTLNQCTLSGNSVTGPSTANWISGGGLYSEFVAPVLTNCTITGNTSQVRGGGISTGGSVSTTNSVDLRNTIVAGNTAPTGPEIYGAISFSNGGNFIGVLGGFTGGTFTDKTFASTGSTLATLLSPLANNGGPTQTHALPAGSPAINGGVNGGSFDTDQRDYGPRIQAGTIDIGAVESGTQPNEPGSLVVTGTGDAVANFDGQNTLREAINYANTLTGSRTITFSNTTAAGAVNFHDGTARFIDIGSQLPILNGQISIVGPGANRLSIRRPATATARYRVFYTEDAYIGIISDLTISGGDAGSLGYRFEGLGGGVANGGVLTLLRCHVTNCYAHIAGGCMNHGTMVIESSVFTANTAVSSGGGVFNVNTHTITIKNTTISGNTASHGAGVAHYGAGTTIITQSTISGNTATGGNAGGGIWTEQPIKLNNCIVAGNTASSASNGHDIKGPVTSNGFNFIGNTSGATGGSITDKTFASTSTTLAQLLSPLANNGGPTMTHALPVGSPAINAGSNGSVGGLTTDQRGYGPRITGSTVDMGAFEFGAGPAATVLGTWRALHGLAANGSQDMGNPSGDQVPNILKYAFNMAPAAGNLNVPNRSILNATGSAGLPLIFRNSSGNLVITFVRRKASTSPGITYEAQVSSNLQSFTTLSLAGATITSIDATWERVTVTDTGTFPTRFGRVSISITP